MYHSVSVELTIDPREERFSGQVGIEIDIKALNEGRVVLHGQNMTVHVASIRHGDTRLDATVETGPNGSLWLETTPPPPPGKATLYLAFDAPLPRVPEGLYRTQEGDAWYAFTQFEPLEARKAFPCFDQPEFKTPFSFRVTVPRGMSALANTPELSRQDAGEMTVFEFGTSKPLPTYLVAFAVGDFDIVSAPPGRFPSGLTFRVAAVKGKGTLTDFVMETTPGILEALSQYFGQPYLANSTVWPSPTSQLAPWKRRPGDIACRSSCLRTKPPPVSAQASASTLTNWPICGSATSSRRNGGMTFGSVGLRHMARHKDG